MTPRDAHPTLGSVVRDRRVATGLSLRALAAGARVSPSFVSQFEHDRTRPSIGTLHRIARVLGTTAQALLAESSDVGNNDGSGTVTVHRAGAGSSVQHDADPADGVVRSLVVGPASPFHVMDIVGAPTEFGDAYQHDGHELLLVIEGPVEVEVGSTAYRLESGDSITYPATLPHQTRRLGPTSRIVIVTAAG